MLTKCNHPEALQNIPWQFRDKIYRAVRVHISNMTVFPSCCTVYSFFLSIQDKNMQQALFARSWTVSSYFFVCFWKKGTVSSKKEIQNSSFVQTRIKCSLLLEKHSSTIEQCVSNSLASLRLYSLGNFPEKGRLQKPSLTLNLAKRHFWSSFQVQVSKSFKKI